MFPSKVLHKIASEAGVRYVTTLRDDVLPGAPGETDHSYMGMMRHNVTTMLEALGGTPASLCHLPPGARDEVAMSHALLALRRVSAAYASQPVFTDLDVCLTPGQFAALVGPTGGKKHLLKLILGLLPCTQGSVRVCHR